LGVCAGEGGGVLVGVVGCGGVAGKEGERWLQDACFLWGSSGNQHGESCGRWREAGKQETWGYERWWEKRAEVLQCMLF
nr:hypothetical protein [Tanacetum cinerariifolium]